MEKTEWLSQVRKGVLEYSILAIICRRPVYGYDLIATLGGYEVLSTTEGTVYPLLRRLEKNGLIVSFWKETAPGTPPRRYYDLTENGAQVLAMMDTEWHKVVQSIEKIKEKEVRQ
jgi:PadR family transcriptional regulator PadR